MLLRWSSLGKQHLGKFAEQLFHVQFAMAGARVYLPAVDDHGIDFLALLRGRRLEIQIKSVRNEGYVFLRKKHAQLSPDFWIGIARFVDGSMPELCLVPSTSWDPPGDLFVSRDYEGLKSEPEWGLTLSAKTLPAMACYALEAQLEELFPEVSSAADGHGNTPPDSATI